VLDYCWSAHTFILCCFLLNKKLYPIYPTAKWGPGLLSTREATHPTVTCSVTWMQGTWCKIRKEIPTFNCLAWGYCEILGFSVKPWCMVLLLVTSPAPGRFSCTLTTWELKWCTGTIFRYLPQWASNYTSVLQGWQRLCLFAYVQVRVCQSAESNTLLIVEFVNLYDWKMITATRWFDDLQCYRNIRRFWFVHKGVRSLLLCIAMHLYFLFEITIVNKKTILGTLQSYIKLAMLKSYNIVTLVVSLVEHCEESWVE